MAVSSPLNRGYAPGSLAARPTQFAGGVRSRDEDPGAFRNRMDSGRASNAATAGVQPPMSRQDNILAARMDGTFDPKRNAYNQQGQATGHSMDAAGNITTPPVAQKPGGSLVPGSAPGTSVWKPAAPAANPTLPPTPTPTPSQPATIPPTVNSSPPPAAGPQMRRVGQINGMPAPLAIEQAKGVTPPVTNNVTSNVTSRVTPPSPSRPGGMMGAVAQAGQGIQTAMTSPNPLAVVPRAQAINQTWKTQQAARPPAGMPSKPLWPPHLAARVVAQNKLDQQPRPISRAGLGLPPSNPSPKTKVTPPLQFAGAALLR